MPYLSFTRDYNRKRFHSLLRIWRRTSKDRSANRATLNRRKEAADCNAKGATLSRRLGGWQVTSWVVLLSLPMMAVIALFTPPAHWSGVGAPAWISLICVSIFSMQVGFRFGYRGLLLGGIAGVGQPQLLQPFFGLTLAALLLPEPVARTTIGSTAVVVLCVTCAKRFA